MPPAAAALAVILGLLRRRASSIAALTLLAGLVVGIGEAHRNAATAAAPVPAGVVALEGVAVTDPIPHYRGGSAFLLRPDSVLRFGVRTAWNGPVLLVHGEVERPAVGERVAVVGAIDAEPDRHRGRTIGGVIEVRSIDLVGGSDNPLLAVGNALRRRILGSLEAVADRPSGALLSGFLIGDVSRLPRSDNDALRRAGLSHFVAVSGSNVALFLGAWWVVGGPLGMGPRRRAVYGLIGLGVFVIVTRWEPSVVRASVMAGLVLIGRLVGRPITPWTALGGAVGLSLLVAPGLAGSVGFALSVAATAGIIAGSPLWTGRRPRPLWAVLGATLSAQVAVAPLLMIWFGSVPLVAPASNLLAAPLVTVATGLGGMGTVIGWKPLVEAGEVVARAVLAIARTSAGLPHVTPVSAAPAALAIAAAVRWKWARPAVAAGVVVAVAASVVPGRTPSVPMVSFLDVGQGDSTVFRGPAGEVVLVDGGPDADLLRRRLAGLGVRRIDLLVVSHRHADHVSGLIGLAQVMPIGLVWHAPQLGEGPVLDGLLAEVRDRGTPVLVPEPGDRAVIGEFVVEARGPLRRYGGPNDGSVVVEVRARSATVVMTGDIEVFAQRDLGPLPGEIMKVPHQGAATSDLDWLAASAPAIAVISVGANDFGHPSALVVDALEGAGASVVRTDRHGTITIPLGDVTEMIGALPSGS